MSDPFEHQQLGRRAFLQNGCLYLTVAMGSSASLRAHESFANEKSSVVRAGLITDLHYADKPAAGSRYYRETLQKLAEAKVQFERSKPAFLVELGDLIDAADSVQTERKYLSTINREFSAICKDRHYVLGNHCVDTLTKEEFLGDVGQNKSYYSFDREGVHFIVLDSCFRSDGKPYQRKNFRWTDANIPSGELDWLKSDLKNTEKPVVVFAHQRLDVSTNHGVKNNAEVRAVLEESKKVLAVFQGHSHKNDLKTIGDIHYCTLVAMVEGSGIKNNGFSVLDIHSDGSLKLEGFVKQQNYTWNQKNPSTR